MAGDVQRAQPAIIVVMGVAGAGKTTVGQLLSQQLGWTFVEADDCHSAENREKLSAGIPLTDEDRSRWLRTLNNHLREAAAAGTRVVLACSALAARYRTALVAGLPGVQFVYLRVTPETARNRTATRRHFFHPTLVASQFETLEEPNDALAIDGSRPALEIVAEIRRQLFTEPTNDGGLPGFRPLGASPSHSLGRPAGSGGAPAAAALPLLDNAVRIACVAAPCICRRGARNATHAITRTGS